MSSLRAFRRSTTRAVPSTEGPSSSEVMRSAIEPAWSGRSATKRSAATTNAAMEDFMSAAPRPNSLPSRTVGTNGSECHSESGPVGTTSVWPAKQTTGCAPPRRAQRLVTSPNLSGSQRNPDFSSRAAISSWQPPSSGVIERRAMSSWASSSAPPRSGIHVDLEVVERGTAGGKHAFLLLGAGLLARLLGRRRALRRQGLAADLAGGRLVDEPQHVGRRVGVGHRLFLRDLAFHEELEQRLLEGLRARRHALLERLLDLVDLALLDQLRDVAGVEQHFHRRYAGA